MSTESTEPAAPDAAPDIPTADAVAELRILAAYAEDPSLPMIRRAYLSGLLHGRGIDPNTYEVGAGDSITLDHQEP